MPFFHFFPFFYVLCSLLVFPLNLLPDTCSTLASLTNSHAPVDPCIPAIYSSNDFLIFFDIKIIKIREIIQNMSSASAPSIAYLVSDGVDMSLRPPICLDLFTPIEFNEFSSLMNS